MCTGSLLQGLNGQDVALTTPLFPSPGSSMEDLYLYLPSVVIVRYVTAFSFTLKH